MTRYSNSSDYFSILIPVEPFVFNIPTTSGGNPITSVTDGVGGQVTFNSLPTAFLTVDPTSTGAYAPPTTFQFLTNLPTTAYSGTPFNFIETSTGITLKITGYDVLTTNVGGVVTAAYTNVTGLAFDTSAIYYPFASGNFTFSQDSNNNTFGNGEIEIVPTPALLPGLLGMGIAAWRKRKQEAMEDVEV